MRKERDIQVLNKVAQLLKEAFRSVVYDIEDIDEIFNSDRALEVLNKYSLINASLDEILYDLSCYFEDLAFVHEENKANKKTKEEIASIFEQIASSEEFSEIVNFDLNNEVYNPNFNTQQVTFDNSTEVLKQCLVGMKMYKEFNTHK